MIKQQILERRKNVNKEKKMSVFSVHCSHFTIDTKEVSNEANNSLKSYDHLAGLIIFYGFSFESWII
jgi:hypothetical protein